MTEKTPPLIEVRDLVKRFGSVIALNGVSMSVHAGEVLCLLGDNGAGKSTLIKTLSGVHQHTSGDFLVSGEARVFSGPRDAMAAGIATVYQDLAMIPLMSVTRNFFMGREPMRGRGVFRQLDLARADIVTRQEMQRIGIDVRDPQQAVGTLSGGERQCVAIARAVYFGAKVLILDEPTSALGVTQTAMVLKYIDRVRQDGIGVIFITHNVRHAYAVGDRFTILNRGRTLGTFARDAIAMDALYDLMAGGKALQHADDALLGNATARPGEAVTPLAQVAHV
ncbi:ATP-binding cassette domain-containing protein [Methylobacterium soli]|uniref:Sugar ABC transporter ATP-binding protein n=1 Tax=Methylobacterium soli TaxID=553447 RepID=A0A6L3SYS9_9HYPH|nr:ATP-binding cassette domain-containing protein [Methylobacterium soli]KAB1077409.1 sugar ABC transporter ATP-binding protein [Methylobacterium soli]GJE44433.1 Fructose import ATP-binding protein FrcA [Methylobacterium soli]